MAVAALANATAADAETMVGGDRDPPAIDFEAGQNLPHDLGFTDGHRVTIVTYAVLMVVSAVGNGTVLACMRRRRRKARARIDRMLTHLAIADLSVRTPASLACGPAPDAAATATAAARHVATRRDVCPLRR